MCVCVCVCFFLLPASALTEKKRDREKASSMTWRLKRKETNIRNQTHLPSRARRGGMMMILSFDCIRWCGRFVRWGRWEWSNERKTKHITYVASEQQRQRSSTTVAKWSRWKWYVMFPKGIFVPKVYLNSISLMRAEQTHGYTHTYTHIKLPYRELYTACSSRRSRNYYKVLKANSIKHWWNRFVCHTRH